MVRTLEHHLELERKASQVDPVVGMAGDIWVFDGRMWVLRREIVEQIWRLIRLMFHQFGGHRGIVVRVCVVGSITTLQHHRFSDFDLNIEVDRDAFKKRVLKLFGEVEDRRLYGFMMDRLYHFLEGIPVEGTDRTFSVHVYWYPYILASDNIYRVFENGSGYWIKGMNFPDKGFDPDFAFEPIRLRVSVLRRIISSLLSFDSDIVRGFLKSLEKFFKDWRSWRFHLAKKGKGHFLSYRFSEDWDSGNIALKYLGEFAKPYKLLYIFKKKK